MASGLKIRNREDHGRPAFYLDQRALNYIRDQQCTVFIYDDEIRQGGTLNAILKRLAGYAPEVVYCTVKAFCADDEDGLTAINYLENPLLTRIIFTDAVRPLNQFSPTVLKKLEIVYLEPELEQIARYLSKHMAEPDNPEWLRNSNETGTDLRLDISVEQK